jgi:predicted phosphodiesterase
VALKDEFLKALEEQPEPPRRTKWSPGLEWTGDQGTITTEALPEERSVEWDHVLRHWGLDPEHFQVVEPVLFNSWGGEDGGNNRQYKAKVIRRLNDSVDLDPLIKEALKRKPPKKVYEGEGVLVVALADWQIGKSDGDGLEGTIGRVLEAREGVIQRVKELRRVGRPIAKLIVLWTGDSIEGCMGHYATQTFSVELDRRDQVKVTRRLLLDSLMEWSKHFTEVHVASVAGNHGENRLNGKAFTSLSDNDDLAIVEMVQEILAANPDAFGHVKFFWPADSITMTLESAGWILGMTHGHMSRGGATAEAKIRTWWQKQAAGKQPIGDADVLVTGHYHHLRMADWGGCVWIQSPAMDGGSDWWKLSSGEVSEPGTVTFAMYPDQRVADFQIV